MQIRFVAAAAVAAALTFSPLVRAEDAAPRPCPSTAAAAICDEAPRDQFRPESHVRSVVENFLRYRVARVGVDGGCYAVLASDRSGTPYEVRFRGNDLKMVSRYVVKDAPLNAPSYSQ
jgi:hypothetical protein